MDFAALLAAVSFNAAELARAIAVRTGEDIRNRLTAAFNLNPDATALDTAINNLTQQFTPVGTGTGANDANRTDTNDAFGAIGDALNNISARLVAIETAINNAK